MLIINRGLPASGKTTWARHWVAEDPENRARVSRDGFRAMLKGTETKTSPHEAEITAMAENAVRALLRTGKWVVVDDTSLPHRRVRQWLTVAEQEGHNWEVKDFTSVSLEECLRRNSGRLERVPAQVIRDYHQRYVKSQKVMAHEDWTPLGGDAMVEVEPYVEPTPYAPRAVIVDIDGTLALMNGRSPYDYTKVDEDLVNQPVFDHLEGLQRLYPEIVTLLVTGRPESCRELTASWLEAEWVHYDRLYMRTDEEHQTQVRDDKVKLRIFNDHIRHNYRVHSVLDDRRRVVKMWRSLGLTTLQVAEGDF